MTILAIDDNVESMRELADNLKEAFPQEAIVAFDSPLLATQYTYNHATDIGLVFSAMTMRQMDGIALVKELKRYAPGAAIYFIVQTENDELAEIASQHCNGTCLPRPVAVEQIRHATRFLRDPCPWEGTDCEAGCMWKWCEHRNRNALA